MDEYINRESIYKTLSMEKPFGWNNDDLAELFREAKPADVAPVRHGRWTWNEEGEIDWEQFYRCSNCGDKEYWESKFCPNCGAAMDLEK